MSSFAKNNNNNKQQRSNIKTTKKNNNNNNNNSNTTSNNDAEKKKLARKARKLGKRQLQLQKMAEKAATWGPEVMRDVEKSLLLQVLDQVWKEHLLAMDHLRQGIGLRAYGQKDPLNEY